MLFCSILIHHAHASIRTRSCKIFAKIIIFSVLPNFPSNKKSGVPNKSWNTPE